MGKINEYQRKQLASSAVGVAGPDRSGEIIGGAAAKLGGVIAQKEQERYNVLATVQANDALMEAGMSVQRVSNQLKTQYAANPDAYPAAFVAAGQEVIANAAEAIQDPGVRKKFLPAAHTMLRAAAANAPQWSFAQRESNAKVAAAESVRKGTLAVGNATNIAELEHNMATVEQMGLVELSKEADVLDEKEVEKWLGENMPGVMDTYFINQIRNNPQFIKDELKSGAYRKTTGPLGKYFTKEMEDKYIAKADTRLAAIRAENVRLQTLNYGKHANDLIEEKMDPTAVDAQWENRNTNVGDSINDAQRAKLMGAWLKKVDLEAGKTKSEHPKSKDFIDLVYSVFDDKVDQAKMLDKMIDVWEDNWTDPDELKFLTNFKVEAQRYEEQRGSAPFYQGAKIIESRVKRYFTKGASQGSTDFNDMVESTISSAFSSYVKKAMTGMPAEAAASAVVKEVETAKVLKDDPSLITAEEPIEAAYLKAAEQYLIANNRSTEKAHIENVARQIRANQGKKE